MPEGFQQGIATQNLVYGMMNDNNDDAMVMLKLIMMMESKKTIKLEKETKTQLPKDTLSPFLSFFPPDNRISHSPVDNSSWCFVLLP